MSKALDEINLVEFDSNLSAAYAANDDLVAARGGTFLRLAAAVPTFGI
jgi:hypothetical protein